MRMAMTKPMTRPLHVYEVMWIAAVLLYVILHA